jgi:hypothetical protein
MVKRVLLSAITVFSTSACIPPAPRWKPALTSEVPDRTPARFRVARDSAFVDGTADGWQRGTPRLRLASGAVVAIPRDAVVQVRLAEKQRHPYSGAVIGWVAGVVTMYATCAPPKQYCGEENPLPLLGILTGWGLGYVTKTEWWVNVRVPADSAAPPQSRDP